LEDDSEGEEENLEEAELLAEASEGELDDEGELPAEAEGEGQSEAAESTTGDAPAGEAPGDPGDRTYTLREPNQRPRFAPRRRRGRRGGPGGGGDRGPRRPEGRREPQRSGGNHHPVQIAEVLKEGQEILVQIAKEPLGTKGARITSHVALPGRYLVYMPTIDHIGVSRKISSEEERLRLRNIILENKGPLTGGFIVRTAGQGRSEEEFKADLKFLSTLWAEIRSKHDRLKAPALIHRDLDLVQRLLRDLLTPDFKCVRVDSEIDYERVLDFVNRCQPALVGKVKLYSRDTPLYEEFGIQAELDKALKPKVWLKSGGYIVINQTEALVAVDVNTGKFVGKTNRLEDTIVKTNVDAVNEIVRQVRLRDLGGIIVIDFIDMDERKNRAKVVQALEEALRSDRAPTKVIAFNDFGLVAVTRKRVKQSLERTLCVPCNYCTGSGWVKSVNTVCNEILAEARKMAKGIDGNVLTLRVNPEVAKALKSREGSLVSELESMTRKDVIIKGDPTVHQERFEIY
jgi:ribonuclease G